jgi:hypothetical protein
MNINRMLKCNHKIQIKNIIQMDTILVQEWVLYKEEEQAQVL